MIPGIKKDIERKELLEYSLAKIKGGHTLIVGAPGVGKTFVLRQLVTRMKAEERHLAVIDVERNLGDTAEEIEKQMGLSVPLHQALSDLSGSQEGLLFIDGLDAARNEKTQAAYRNLVKRVQENSPNWRIVAAIRTFDATRSRDIRLLFPLESETHKEFSDPRIKQRHVLVPTLSEGELQEAARDSEELSNLLAKAQPSMQNLLRVPRNIELAVKLIKDGLPIDKISGLQSEVQLLTSIWGKYVLTGSLESSKRAILRTLSQDMFEHRAFSANRGILSKSENARLTEAVDELLNHEILAELSLGSDIIRFSNQTYYDYALARHVIPEDSLGSLSVFVANKEYQVFFNPSVRYFLAFQWFYRRDFFWNVVDAVVQSDGLNPSITVMPFVTITDESLERTDVAGLIDLLKRSKRKDRILYYFLISILRHLKEHTRPQTWWVIVLRDIIVHLDERAWWLFVELVSWFGEKGRIERVKGKPEEFSVLGSCARELLRRGWEIGNLSVEGPNARRVIGIVCSTYDTDKEASRDLLSYVVERVGDPKASVEEIYWLCASIEDVIRHDAEFAVDVYAKVFSYEEKSDEKTHMGGFVLSLTSTRKQDYQMCQYHLQEAFEQFLSMSPVLASRALIRSVEGYIENRERQPNENIPVIPENGINYCIDFSYIWDSNRTYEEDARKMLSQFEDWLSTVKDRNVADRVFTEIVSINRQAVIWRRILFAVSRNPSTLLQAGLRLLTTKAVLIGRDTRYVATQALQALFPNLNNQQKREVENVLLELSTYDASWEFIKERMRDALATKQAELVAVVPADLIISVELKQLREILNSEKKLTKPQPAFEMTDMEMVPHVERDWLKEQGVEVEKKENARLIEIHDEIRTVNSIFDDKSKTLEAIQDTWKHVAKLWSEYKELAPKGDERARERAMTTFAEYASNLTRYKALDLSSEYGIFIREIVDVSISDPEPRYNAKYHSTFTTPHWSPAPRIEGVESLLYLLINGKIPADSVKNIVIGFSKDEVPVIRFFVARHLSWLYRLDKSLFWSVADNILKTETKATVAILTTFLHSLAALMNEKDVRSSMSKTVSQVIKIVGSDNIDREVSKVAFDILTELYVFYDDADAMRILQATLESGLSASNAVFYMLRSSLSATILGIASQAGKRDDADSIRERSIKFVFLVLNYVAEQVEFIRKNPTKVQQEDVREFYRLVDAFGDHFYLDVDWGHEHQRKETPPFLEEERRRYFSEVAKPILLRLIEICDPEKQSGIPAGTAHHLLEIAPSLLKIDFKGVLNIVHGIVHASKPSGYPLDSFAMRDLEEFVNVCLADHRPRLRDDPDALRLLTDILDVFVEVGWSEALGLVLRLDQVFV